MTVYYWLDVIYMTVAILVLRKIQIRLRLSRAKHPTLSGHAKMSRLVAKLLPFYEYGPEHFFTSDSAPENIAAQRQAGFQRLQKHFAVKSPKSIALSKALEPGISDVLFTNAYRVPFQYRNYVKTQLELGSIVTASAGTMIEDLDENWSYDLTGSYGVNVFGYDFYKQ